MLPIYGILNNNQQVKDLLTHGGRLRVWGFGYADESQVGPNPIQHPYATYQIINETPENGLSCHSISSDMQYQFDIYARSGESVEAISKALQSALRVHGFITAIRHPTFEADTKLYAGSFDFSYIQTE